MPPTHRTGSPSGLLPHFRCRKQYRKAPALLALRAGPGLFLLRAGDRASFLNFRPRGFAPPSLLALILPSWGANFFLPGVGRRALGLLPFPFYPLFLRLGEQTFSCPVPAAGPRVCSPFPSSPYFSIQGEQTFSCPVPANGPWVCSPLPSSPYSSVQGSKLFPARRRRMGLEFAPHSSLALISPLWGANFFLLGAGGWAFGLLPTPR